MIRRRKTTLQVLALGAVVAFLAVACVANPGPFTITAQAGSAITLEDGSGNPTQSFDLGRPSCGDGVDNDLDGQTDGSDAQCDSATDHNERIDGVQTFVKGSLPIEIDEAGVITTDPTELTAQPREVCALVGASVWCLAVTIDGVGSEEEGTIEEDHVELPLTVSMDLDAVVGFPGLPGSCSMGPVGATYTSNSYNTTTGETVLTALNTPAPAITTCGDYNAALNGFLGLPTVGDGTISATVLDSNGNPVQFTE